MMYVKVAIAVLFLVLLGLVGYLNGRVNHLQQELGAKDQVVDTLSGQVKVCSDNTEKLRIDGEAANENYLQALREADKASAENRKLAQQLLAAKPKVPVITKTNEGNFGPTDGIAKIQDYNAAHQLFNDYVTGNVK